MLFSVEQAFVGREEIRTPLKTPAWEATRANARLVGKFISIGDISVSIAFQNTTTVFYIK